MVAANERRVLESLSFCTDEFMTLAKIRQKGCPALGVQMRTFEKLLILAEGLGYLEHKREGSIKLVRLTDKGREALANK